MNSHLLAGGALALAAACSSGTAAHQSTPPTSSTTTASTPSTTTAIAPSTSSVPTAPTGGVTAAPATSRTALSFRTLDITFVSTQRAWALGDLTSGLALRETTDRGATWTKLPTPPTGVTHVRFADTVHGYAWGQGLLWITSNGGRSWSKTSSTFVSGLEIGAGRVWVLATTLPYPAVLTSAAGATSFTKVGTAPNRSDVLTVHGSDAYVLGPAGAGPVASSLDLATSHGLTRLSAFPCTTATTPTEQLAASTDGTLVLLCSTISNTSKGYASTDQGRTWFSTSAPGFAPTALAVSATGRLAAGTDLFLKRSTGGYRDVLRGKGFALVGFQDDTHAVAVSNSGLLSLSSDGGQTWKQVTP